MGKSGNGAAETRREQKFRWLLIPHFILSSIRNAFSAVMSSWLLLCIFIIWLCFRFFGPTDPSWAYLSKIPVIGIAVDFVWCAADFAEALYKVEWKYRWMPGALTNWWNLLPTKEASLEALKTFGQVGATIGTFLR